ncbi:16S rRNA (cytidine(1402)-2'-O)-methyltransferase [Microbacterium esteraromaticum]|uniref:Ribosomal RNA small subunit methyltransferase I n=1 Tax=Microbacterium esteraromaticum TaxID=57043 RepID=A0A939ISJ0_9MICO|nr:16S rRNA (cytidine(1402)-2'-O)-methyltransferase [Microbacterium esteraromaticum]MBN8206915.1 16S rRNA (cytidine(1402)-2'-O)-methyltransferase [Microbacterium esteraromaticum]MBN8417070.1 16S rRNA (cytidine(1402)-2'-O)-methyltransferase [Microbacterium esteraromaticum]MBN8425699.1 16S rRNA (cytidine(1402)-2'-O)-methyltransferase [Microbacterium esteraromaticum]
MIILAATPIGNLGDASRRLIEVLENAEIVAAEDTRTTQRLLKALQIDNRPRLIALHDHNEKHKAVELAEIAADQDVVVVSDAGMPAISDPGYGLVAAAVERGVTVTAVPGPSAALMALAISGMPTDRFTFEGFLPRKPGERRQTLRMLASEPRTMIFFESPARLATSLADMGEAFGADRRIAVCRELTKLYEEVRRGTADELVAWAEAGVKGEIVVVVEGAVPVAVSAENALAQVQALVASGLRLKEACAEVAAATGLSSRDLYQAALAAR